jgi:hypothetical protein
VVQIIRLLRLSYYIFPLILQTRDDARQFMKYLHPDLGVGNAIIFSVLVQNSAYSSA